MAAYNPVTHTHTPTSYIHHTHTEPSRPLEEDWGDEGRGAQQLGVEGSSGRGLGKMVELLALSLRGGSLDAGSAGIALRRFEGRDGRTPGGRGEVDVQAFL